MATVKTTNENNKELSETVNKLSTRISVLRDELASMKNDVHLFKESVSKDLKNIVTFLGKNKK